MRKVKNMTNEQYEGMIKLIIELIKRKTPRKELIKILKKMIK